MRNDTMIRVIGLCERLEAGRLTLAEAAREAGVCERTIRRDLEALSVAGVPVTGGVFEDRKYYWITK